MCKSISYIEIVSIFLALFIFRLLYLYTDISQTNEIAEQLVSEL